MAAIHLIEGWRQPQAGDRRLASRNCERNADVSRFMQRERADILDGCLFSDRGDGRKPRLECQCAFDPLGDTEGMLVVAIFSDHLNTERQTIFSEARW